MKNAFPLLSMRHFLVCILLMIQASAFAQVAGPRTLWAWGDNSAGDLGDGTDSIRYSPVEIGDDKIWLLVSAGYAHTVAIRNGGMLWAWGNNVSGQLGDGSDGNCHVPVQIGDDTNWLYISAGYYHTMALKNDGTL